MSYIVDASNCPSLKSLCYKGLCKCTTSGCRSCGKKLTSNDTASQYQKLKIIQNTVRVASSLYTMNLGALSAYRYPNNTLKVNWNQMSDRESPSYQQTYIPRRGGSIGGNSTKSTLTSSRPGAQSPGGKGCDIKHNSYNRYLNKLKGQGPLRRGDITNNGTIKTNIINGCNCPITTN
jgi:hypothetical protein